MPELAEASRPRTPRLSKRRNYQACLECKKQKVKCDLGDSETPQPPCTRCRRASLDCIFGPARKIRTRERRPNSSTSIADAENVIAAPAQRSDQPPQVSGSTDDDTNFGTGQEPLRLGRDADNIGTGLTTPPAYDLSVWTHFPLCQDGCLSPREAHHLAGYFFQNLHPQFPLVDPKYSDSLHWGELLAKEILLCATILTIAARYTWYSASASSTRAVETHGILYRQVQTDIQNSLWSSSLMRTRSSTVLGIVESIVLIDQWHPRPLDVIPFPGEVTGGYPFRLYGFDPATAKSSIEVEVRRTYEVFRPLNIASWRLLVPAISLADEIGLHQSVTQLKENELSDSSDQRRCTRVCHLLVSLVWERSFRLGRKCLLAHPPGTPTTDDIDVVEALLESRTELYRLMRLIENTLYTSVAKTADTIAYERYQSMVEDLSGLLASWRTRFERIPGTSTLAKHIDLTYHTGRTWLYSVALQGLHLVEQPPMYISGFRYLCDEVWNIA